MNPSAIILAGGASSRMGRPKALLTLDGETFADRLIALFAPFCRDVIVVLGHDADTIRAGIRRHAAFALNPQPERGMLSSLHCGLLALPAAATHFLFTPVDHPLIAPSTVETLLANIGTRTLAIPQYDGRRGHPVCCAAALRDELLALPPDARASDVIHRHLAEAALPNVQGPGILATCNHPEEYQRLLARAEASLP